MQDSEQGFFQELEAMGGGDTAAMPEQPSDGGMSAPSPDGDAMFEIGTGAAAGPSDAAMDSMTVPAAESVAGSMADSGADAMNAPEPMAAPEPAMATMDTTQQTPAMAQDASGGSDPPGAFDEALEALGDALSTVFDTMPTGVMIALVAGSAIVVGIMVGLWVGRRRGPGPVRHDPVLSPQPAPAQPAPAPSPDVATLAPENPAFIAYQKILEDKGVPAKDQDIRLRDFSATLEQLRAMLDALKPGDPSLRPSVDEARQALGAGDFETVVAHMARLGDREAEVGMDLHRHAQAQLNAAATARIVAGDLQFAQMAYAEAARSYRAALESLPAGNDERRAEYLNKLGTAAYQAGDMDRAADAFQDALTVLERHLGNDHPDVATALNNLALLQYSRGLFEEAEPLYQRALVIDETALGADHPGVATDLNNLALLYKKQNRLRDAEPLLRRALEIKEKTFDPGHPSLVTGLKNYASLLRALGREDEAKAYEQRAGALPPKRRADERAA